MVGGAPGVDGRARRQEPEPGHPGISSIIIVNIIIVISTDSIKTISITIHMIIIRCITVVIS